ncbi:GNAT family N-acetyltransferase [Sanguibacter sp. A247]|uniref:GNAT family N-acetyltransferase n=1 Tax=unclassified Sanguibacter TaxID=2645534 RepID=UPI003FD89356
MTTIRHTRTADAAEVARLYDVCIRTGAAGGDASGLYAQPELLPAVYLGAYLALEPGLAFVLADDDDNAVGYVIGAADTRDFAARCEREWWPALRERFPLGSAEAGTLDAKLIELIHAPVALPDAAIDRFPAHLHVDLLPEGQGGGNGRRLLETLFDALRARGVTALHLGVDTTNTHAVGFYEHLGFRPALPDSDWIYGIDL